MVHSRPDAAKCLRLAGSGLGNNAVGRAPDRYGAMRPEGGADQHDFLKLSAVQDLIKQNGHAQAAPGGAITHESQFLHGKGLAINGLPADIGWDLHAGFTGGVRGWLARKRQPRYMLPPSR